MGANRAFTLVELVVAIAIASVIGAVIATYLTVPLRASADVARRAALTDEADTALRRLDRDLSRALPNSVRVATLGPIVLVEYLDVRTAGRYRSQPSGGATGTDTCPDTDSDGLANEDVLTIGAGVLGPGVSDTCFRSLGNVTDLASIVPNADYVVVNNTGDAANDGDAYANGAATGANKARILAVSAAADAENRFVLENNPAIASFTRPSSVSGFHVVSGPVTWQCDPTTGRLTRHAGYAIQAAQPTAFPQPGSSSAILATSVAACTVAFRPAAGLISLTLSLARDGETVNLYHEIHVVSML